MSSIATIALAQHHCSSQRTTAPSPAPEAPAFELRSGMWINLHQELLHHARTTWKWRHRVLPERAADPSWNDAVEVYRSRYADLENLDDALSMLAVELATAGSAEALDVRGDLGSVLMPAAEAYRRERWPADDRRNREWIANVTPLLERFGDAMRTEIAHANDTTWPKGTVPIEVVTFVDPYGGQTTDAPSPLTLISSADPGYAGQASLEMIFHETSHLFDDQLRNGITEVCRTSSVAVPDGLWHAILFYTAGYYAKKHLGESYVPYAEAHGLFKRGGWDKYLHAIVTAWEPHLREETTMLDALRDVVKAINP